MRHLQFFRLPSPLGGEKKDYQTCLQARFSFFRMPQGIRVLWRCCQDKKNSFFPRVSSNKFVDDVVNFFKVRIVKLRACGICEDIDVAPIDDVFAIIGEYLHYFICFDFFCCCVVRNNGVNVFEDGLTVSSDSAEILVIGVHFAVGNFFEGCCHCCEIIIAIFLKGACCAVPIEYHKGNVALVGSVSCRDTAFFLNINAILVERMVE